MLAIPACTSLYTRPRIPCKACPDLIDYAGFSLVALSSARLAMNLKAKTLRRSQRFIKVSRAEQRRDNHLNYLPVSRTPPPNHTLLASQFQANIRHNQGSV